MVTSKALSLFDNFNQLTPYAVGYDRIFDQLQRYAANNMQFIKTFSFNFDAQSILQFVLFFANII